MQHVAAQLRQYAEAVRDIQAIGVSPAEAGCFAGQYIQRAIELGAFAGGPRDYWLPPLRERLAFPKNTEGPDPHLSAFSELLYRIWRDEKKDPRAMPEPTSTEAFNAVADVLQSEAKRISNPLMAEPEIHANLKPLFHAMCTIANLSSAIAACYQDMLDLKGIRGLPTSDEWPDSVALERSRKAHAARVQAEREEYAKRGEDVMIVEYTEPRWTSLMREWRGYYSDWCAAIVSAKQEAASLAVSAIMDSGTLQPIERWSSQVSIDLDRLAATLHPSQMGGADGFGFLRCGLPPFPANFSVQAASVCRRIDEMRSIPIAAAPLTLDGTTSRGTADQSNRGIAGKRGIINTDTDWNEVQGRLLVKRERNEPYISLEKLALEMNCSDFTIRKAIEHSEILQDWQARSQKRKAAPKATGLGEVELNNTLQTKEPDPSDVLPEDEVDTLMAQLINKAKPAERAELNALDAAGRRRVAAMAQSHNLHYEPSPLDPDKPGSPPRKVKHHKRA